MSKAFVKGAAPFFKAASWSFKQNKIGQVSLNDFKDKYLLMFFYPLDFTFVCPTEILEFSKKAKEFNAVNTEVIGVSVDSVYSHKKWTETPREQGGLGGLDITLVSDITKEISRDYGVLIPEAGISLRGTFLIDPKQTIRHVSINDLPVGRNVDEYLRLVEAFQFNEQHGEVCPSNWRKGGATINTAKPDSYWKDVHAKQ